jgi:hypothetical protein
MELRVSRAHGCAGATQLKTPYSDGATHVIFEPLNFIAKLEALVPKPRVNLTRFHGVSASNSKYWVDVKLAKRSKSRAKQENEEKTPEQRHQAMTWAQGLKRVFNIDVSVCPRCGGEARVIAIIDKILNHLQAKGRFPPMPELLREPHQIQTGLRSSGFANVSTWYSNTRVGCLVGYCLN